MKIEELSKEMKEEIIQNAINWASGKECKTLEQIDMEVIGEYFSIKFCQTFKRNFISSDYYGHCNFHKGEKTVVSSLDSIRNKILKSTGEVEEKRGRKKGYKATSEQKFKMKKSQQKRVQEEGKCGGQEIKPVVQLSKYDGSFIARYDNAKQALMELGKPTNRSDIGACCRGARNKQTAFGFVWRFEEDYLKTHTYDDMKKVECK